MPNWKSYESSVRLLSAIVAAHPGLKLNYDDVSKFYGDGAKYKSVWDRMNQINKNAKLLTAAVEAGGDPFEVVLDDAAPSRSRARDISARFGGDCTKSALENRFRRLKSDAVKINAAVAKGIDPITLNIGDTDGQVVVRGGREMARCYGSEATPSALKHVYIRNIRPDVLAIHAALKAGGDPKDVILSCDKSKGATSAMAQHFGSDVTAKAINHIFTKKINPDVQNLRAAVSAGTDAKAVALSWTGGSNDVSKAFGSDCTIRGLQCHMQRDILPNVKLIRASLDQGSDPKILTMIEGVRNGNPGKQVSRIFGSDSTPNGIRFQLYDNIVPLGKRQLAALAAGEDPKDLDVVTKGPRGKEMAKLIGSDCTKGALEWQFRRYKAGGKLQTAALKAGQDPKDINVDVGPGGKLSYISKYFGTDSSTGGIGFQFRQIKIDAKRQRDCVDVGRDPKDLGIGLGKEIARYLNDDTTSVALQHRFRPIKKEAEAMKAAVAREYGDGVTDTGTTKSTPRKRAPAKRTPKKSKAPAEDDDEDDSDEQQSPSKKSKSSLNKTQSGRITKTTPSRAARPAPGRFAEEDSDDEEEFIKNEGEEAQHSSANAANGFGGNGYSSSSAALFGNHGNGNANGNGTGKGWAVAAVEEDDTYFEADEYEV